MVHDRSVTPNREQIEYWNGPAGERWVKRQADLDHALSPFGEAALERLRPRPGESILDVGCGAGETLLQIARRLGGSGKVTGLDPSRPLLARARERTAGLGNVELIQADAATHAFDAQFDGVFSRFGVMFFDEPASAFSNLRSALAPAGRLGFVCWQALEENPWLYEALVAARTIVKEPPVLTEPYAPGPFAFAEPERATAMLYRAGFLDVAAEPFEAPVRVSDDGLDAAVEFSLGVGPVARLLVDQPDEVRGAIREQIALRFASFCHHGRVELKGRAWIVTARA